MELPELLKIVDEYYPSGIDFWDDIFEVHPKVQRLRKKAYAAQDDPRWQGLLRSLDFVFRAYDNSLAFQGLPGFTAVLQPEEKWDVSLYLKISIIAPAYLILFSDGKGKENRILRFHPVTDREEDIFSRLKAEITRNFKDYQGFRSGDFGYVVKTLGDIQPLRPRKPYLDECIFGENFSFHPD